MNDLASSSLLRVLRGEKPSRTPVWFMRQAGRFLPEYREVRARHAMLDVIRTPELAAKVTLQPLERFDLDAAIIFADILNPLIGMGIDLDFVEGEGPKISNLISSAADIDRLRVPSPEENVGYTLEAIQKVVAALSPRGIPLFGFSGAPFTLAAYMIEGSGSGGLHQVKRLMLQQPAVWEALQAKLVTLVSEYLVAQVRAGVSVVQIFDSWAGCLGPDEFRRFVAPGLKKIIAAVKSATKAPVIYFATGVAGIFGEFAELGADAYGVDWRMTLSTAASALGGKPILQGNLDPDLLFAPREMLGAEVARIVAEGKQLRGHIFNLGHGILPETPIESVAHAVNVVHGS